MRNHKLYREADEEYVKKERRRRDIIGNRKRNCYQEQELPWNLERAPKCADFVPKVLSKAVKICLKGGSR